MKKLLAALLILLGRLLSRAAVWCGMVAIRLVRDPAEPVGGCLDCKLTFFTKEAWQAHLEKHS